MVFDVLLLLAGFTVLIKAADWLVDGASSLAKGWGVKELVIGLTVVSFGTSAPELVVNLLAVAGDGADLALGNIIGSNISNTLLVLGAAAVIFPLAVKSSTVWREIPLMLLASFAVLFFVNDIALDGANQAVIGRIDGLVLLLFFAIFMYYTWGISRTNGSVDSPDIMHRPMWRSIFLVVGGALGLALGGYLIVDSAEKLATMLNVNQTVVGLTILALGTSVPELATSVMAAYRKHADIAVGNVVGSNIFNLLFVLGITSIVKPLPVPAGLNIDILVMIAAAILLLGAVFNMPKQRVERWEGWGFLGIYGAYIVSLFWRL